ncbi:unnamed protein product [Callosobruchus maculatus]|uniref:FLYWCH-type domain-containing protein n=1 Tax=Callosobruchus maculatus TaxID=64391 RepID=A0A653BW02_CALMS|nr:unnamed protein product [Callosobruchus maculatus]
MSLIKSSRGRDLLVVEHHSFSKQKVLKSGEILWRCIQRNTKCSAKVFTIGCDDLTITRRDLVHNHEADPKKLQVKMVTNACKRKAEEDISEKPAKITRTAVTECDANLLTVPDIACIRKNIYNCRRKLLPGPSPRSISEVHIAVSEVNTVNRWSLTGTKKFDRCNRIQDVVGLNEKYCTLQFNKVVCSTSVLQPFCSYLETYNLYNESVDCNIV